MFLLWVYAGACYITFDFLKDSDDDHILQCGLLNSRFVPQYFQTPNLKWKSLLKAKISYQLDSISIEYVRTGMEYV